MTSDAYLTAVKAYEAKLDDRQYRLNAASVDLTKSIREVWGDENVQLRLVPDGQYLKVVVVDDIGVEVELDQRSEGFRWLVSFFVVFKAQAQGGLKNAILLLDEPGLSLHALKQQEFRKTVSRLAADSQVIYTTHSPFMVGTDELDLVRIVEMTTRDAGTRVHTRLVVDDPRSIYPLQAALGYELAQSLFGQSRNLVCEGLTDMLYVEALNAAFTDVGKGLKTSISLVPASSASKVIYYATVLTSQNLKVAALLDSDHAGINAAKQDELVQLLSSKKILRPRTTVTPGSSAQRSRTCFERLSCRLPRTTAVGTLRQPRRHSPSGRSSTSSRRRSAGSRSTSSCGRSSDGCLHTRSLTSRPASRPALATCSPTSTRR